jgi:hypothetical protein
MAALAPMRLLTATFDPSPRPIEGRTRPVLRVAAVAAGLLAVGTVIEAMGVSGAGGRAVQVAAVHGGFLSAAAALRDPIGRRWQGVGLSVGCALTVAAWLSESVPWGWMAYVLPPLMLGWQGRRLPGVAGVWHGGGRLKGVVLGAGIGIFLGAHLLVTAALTFGYAVAIDSFRAYARELAYDAGANALSAAWFFHGALFSWLWQRLDFWPAAAGATAAALARYLLDPALPAATEVAAGAVFYLGILGVAACALRAWMGGTAPAYAATLAFFAAYRSLSG